MQVQNLAGHVGGIIRALFGEGSRDGATDPAVATSDNCDFPLQFAAPAFAFILRLGVRLHFVLAPRTLPLILRRLTFLLLRHDEILSISARLPAVINFSRKIRPAVDLGDFRLNMLIPRKRGLL
jgi:hypothetical protein